MAKPFKLVIVRARHDNSVATISDEACLQMLMTGTNSVMRFWENTTEGYFDFLDSTMMPWVDISINATATSRDVQATTAFAAIRAREPGRDPLAGFDGAIVLTLPGRIIMPNPKMGQPGQPSTVVVYFDGGSTMIGGLRVSVLPVMSSDHTFMCHELGHTLGFGHTFGLDNNGTDWNPDDPTIIVGPEYGSPYDLMSSASFGSRWLGTGPLYSANPTFTGPVIANWPFTGAAQMGPNISRANLHRWFPDALAMHVADRPFPSPGDVGRVRLGAASSRLGTTLLVLHPPAESASGVGRVYVEYRDAKGWDQGLHISGDDLARAGVVVHTLDDVAGVGPRVWYRGSVATGSINNNLAVATQPIVISLEEYGDQDGNGWVDISYRKSITITKTDILWENTSDGTMQIWVMNGGRVAGRVTVVSETGEPMRIGPPWHIVGTGDFNGDGKADILWANASDNTMQIWMMNGGRIAGRATVVGESGTPEHTSPPWRIVKDGDSNGNGTAEILWHNSATGETQFWFMNGYRVASRATVLGEAGNAALIGPPWSIVGTGDFNLNGTADILWHNSATSETQIWLMNGYRVASRATVLGEAGNAALIGPPWNIVGT